MIESRHFSKYINDLGSDSREVRRGVSNLTGKMFFQTKTQAAATDIGFEVFLVEVLGDVSIADGLTYQYVPSNTGSNDTFQSQDGRTWYRKISTRSESVYFDNSNISLPGNPETVQQAFESLPQYLTAGRTKFDNTVAQLIGSPNNVQKAIEILSLNPGGSAPNRNYDLTWLFDNVRNAQDAIAQLIATQLEFSAISYENKQQIRRQLASEFGTFKATYREDIQVLSNASGAAAAKLETLTAAMGGGTASVNVAWSAIAAPSGYAARYALQAAVNDGQFRAASLLLDVPANPNLPTRIVMEAEQLVFSNGLSGGLSQAFIYQNGELSLNVANIGFVRTGIMESENGKMTINLNQGTIVVRS